MTVKSEYVGFKVEPETMELLEKILKSTGCSKSEYMRQLIRENLEKYNLIKEKMEIIQKTC